MPEQPGTTYTMLIETPRDRCRKRRTCRLKRAAFVLALIVAIIVPSPLDSQVRHELYAVASM